MQGSMEGDPLVAEAITAAVRNGGIHLASPVEVHNAIASTNSNVAAQLAAGARAPIACLAETQTAGRGRHGRRWVSPRGCNIYLSIGLRSERPVADLPAFTLAVAAELAVLLEDPGITVKWPNDLVVDGAKLAGILCESSLAPSGAVALTVGIGLNVAMPAEAGAPVERAWTTLERVSSAPTARGELAARIICAVCAAFPRFAAGGLADWRMTLRRRDCLAGQLIAWREGDAERTGTADGIGADGALRVIATDGTARWLRSGEVTLAPTPVTDA